jgi:hypothetical protein
MSKPVRGLTAKTPMPGASGLEPSTHEAQKYKFVAFQPRECQRCGYGKGKRKWIPVITCVKGQWKQAVPKKCPECKSKAWNDTRERSEWDGRYKRNFDDGG